MSGYGQGPSGALPFGEAANAPFIGNWLPFIRADITRLAVVEFDVTSDSWVVLDTDVRAVFVNGLVETVWTDATGFTERYRRGSARHPIANGHRYYLRRTSGWSTARVRIDVRATDLAAAASSGQSS